jgi:hypothetical protein
MREEDRFIYGLILFFLDLRVNIGANIKNILELEEF